MLSVKLRGIRTYHCHPDNATIVNVLILSAQLLLSHFTVPFIVFVRQTENSLCRTLQKAARLRCGIAK